MEYASFVLGVLSIIFILMVVGMFRINKKLEKTIESLWGFENYKKDIASEIDTIHRRIQEVSDLDNRRIDGEIDRVDKIASDIHRRVDTDIDGIYRTLDSRFDKLENKLTNNSKQLLKD